MTEERSGRPLIVVDAANVVGSRPDGWWRDRAGAARRLLDQLAEQSDRLPQSADLVAVLEGAARRAVEPAEGDRVGKVRVVRASGSGDDEIVAVVAAAARTGSTGPITVVTADRGLRERVESLGAATVGPGWLWERLGGGA